MRRITSKLPVRARGGETWSFGEQVGVERAAGRPLVFYHRVRTDQNRLSQHDNKLHKNDFCSDLYFYPCVRFADGRLSALCSELYFILIFFRILAASITLPCVINMFFIYYCLHRVRAEWLRALRAYCIVHISERTVFPCYSCFT